MINFIAPKLNNPGNKIEPPTMKDNQMSKDDKLPTPVHLYVKIHTKTDISYIGRTIQDPYKYKGSGTAWTKLLEEQGSEHTTLVLGTFESAAKLEAAAKGFSEMNDIVTSDKWSNQKIETGHHPSMNSKEKLTRDQELRALKAGYAIDKLYSIAINKKKFEKYAQKSFCLELLDKKGYILNQEERDTLASIVGYTTDPIGLEKLRLLKTSLTSLEENYAMLRFWREDHSIERREKAGLAGGCDDNSLCELCKPYIKILN